MQITEAIKKFGFSGASFILCELIMTLGVFAVGQLTE